MGKSHLRAALVSALVLLAAAWVPGAVAAGEPDTVVGPWTSQWFVELASPPTADGTSQATLNNEHASFRSAAKAAGVSYTERFAYSTLFNGVAISTSDRGISEPSKLAGVKAASPVPPLSAAELARGPVADRARRARVRAPVPVPDG